MTRYTKFEGYCLALAIPALALPALAAPTQSDLEIRAAEIAYDLVRPDEGEKGLASMLIGLGALAYLEPLHAHKESVRCNHE